MLSKSKTSAIILVVSVLLGALGLIFIYSASCYVAQYSYDDSFFFVKKQAVALAFGIIMMILGHYIDIGVLLKAKWVILAVSVILLALVFIPGLGQESYGATRWISIGGFSFQPSEVSKFGFIIFLAGYFYEHSAQKIKNIIVPVFACLVICLLIMSEPNMSITIVVCLSFLIMLFVTGVPNKFLVCCMVFVVLGGVVLLIVEPYRISRLVAFIDPWENPQKEGYQLIQSFYAIGSGGLFGVGLFNSQQKYLFLPFAESDFIFSIIAEETGLAGSAFVISLFLFLIVFGFYRAIKAENRYKCYLISGCTSIIFLQSVINMMVVCGCIPPTGVPLPFVSFGGSSLVCFMFVAGLISNNGFVPNSRKVS